jgi:hypothetical protein
MDEEEVLNIIWGSVSYTVSYAQFMLNCHEYCKFMCKTNGIKDNSDTLNEQFKKKYTIEWYHQQLKERAIQRIDKFIRNDRMINGCGID